VRIVNLPRFVELRGPSQGSAGRVGAPWHSHGSVVRRRWLLRAVAKSATWSSLRDRQMHLPRSSLRVRREHV